jgi:large subunit ribosomal protein L24
MSLRIKKGDLVMVTASHGYTDDGNSVVYKNRTGRVLAVYPRKGQAIVEGLHIFKKHQKPRSQQDQGGILEIEAPLPLSKLMLVDPSNKTRAARFGTKGDDRRAKSRVLKLGKQEKEVTV